MGPNISWIRNQIFKKSLLYLQFFVFVGPLNWERFPNSIWLVRGFSHPCLKLKSNQVYLVWYFKTDQSDSYVLIWKRYQMILEIQTLGGKHFVKPNLRKSGNTSGKRGFHKGFGPFVSKTQPDQMHNINVVCCLAGTKAGISRFCPKNKMSS